MTTHFDKKDEQKGGFGMQLYMKSSLLANDLYRNIFVPEQVEEEVRA
jgi:hypothetical protein